MKPLADYELVLAGRGDTRRLWAERFLDIKQPRHSGEAWAMRDVLARLLAAPVGKGQ
jgi:hypothetical protein